MRLLLLPNGFRDPVIKGLYYDDTAQALLQPRGPVCRIAICQDGRGTQRSLGDIQLWSEAIYLRKYYQWFGQHCEFLPFSFGDSMQNMRAILEWADVFYMCGFGGGFPEFLRRLFDPLGPGKAVVDLIRARVQYDEMAYIGICGGAMAAGRHYWSQPRSTCCFDFLEGVDVAYDANDSTIAKKTPRTDATAFQMTCACGIAINMRYPKVHASSVIVVKNSAQWTKFASENSKCLKEACLTIADTWFPYYHASLPGTWWFRLDGLVIYNGVCRLL